MPRPSKSCYLIISVSISYDHTFMTVKCPYFPGTFTELQKLSWLQISFKNVLFPPFCSWGTHFSTRSEAADMCNTLAGHFLLPPNPLPLPLRWWHEVWRRWRKQMRRKGASSCQVGTAVGEAASWFTCPLVPCSCPSQLTRTAAHHQKTNIHIFSWKMLEGYVL